MPKLIQTRKSAIHGKGVFALVDIPKGTRIIEYKGELISNEEADHRHPTHPDDPFHTFFFSLSESDFCIDGNVKGNAARWINHACSANCASEEEQDRRGRSHVYICAMRNIKAGDELHYDYRLSMAGRITKKDKLNYACRCGTRKCRGTMLWIE